MYVTAIIAAGGRGQRFGGAVPKQLLTIGGRTVLQRSVEAFASHPSVDEVIVVLPAEIAGDPPSYLRGAASGGTAIRIVTGGSRRQDSVANAFRAVSDRTDVIVIHDAARPFASADLITRTIGAAAEGGAAVAAVQARDTVKLVVRQAHDEGSSAPFTLRPSEGERVVRSTIPRETIYLAQTPQAFRRSVLGDALAAADAGGDATDEASLAERAGHPVRIVDGESSNIKITTPDDLAVAEAIANELSSAIRNPQSPIRNRVGTGYDLHRLVEGRPLVLGGVTIPADRGALGHSDADVVCHALTDAILGAASLGDIGRHFPDSAAEWKDASSLDLLTRVVGLVTARGFEVGNVDVTVILETPKIKNHVDAMRAAVAQAIGIDIPRVSIKGKTNEGVDAVGRGEAIAAHAVALLRLRTLNPEP
jgi:2-C-methyl-D-erythritol 4-phosphate cytidylyltransferase/2-C-methyl-D-erythritol 2,4-cyclodiphosphate synthase